VPLFGSEIHIEKMLLQMTSVSLQPVPTLEKKLYPITPQN
jgi:hypothetical protein